MQTLLLYPTAAGSASPPHADSAAVLCCCRPCKPTPCRCHTSAHLPHAKPSARTDSGAVLWRRRLCKPAPCRCHASACPPSNQTISTHRLLLYSTAVGLATREFAAAHRVPRQRTPCRPDTSGTMRYVDIHKDASTHHPASGAWLCTPPISSVTVSCEQAAAGLSLF